MTDYQNPDLADARILSLGDTDRIALETGSGIRSEVSQARGYYTETDKRRLPGIGFTASSTNLPALVLPLHTITGETVYQIRPHQTPKDANGRETRKYLLPKGSALIVDCNPLACPDVMNPDIPLWITEGAKKADAAISQGLPCVSISGVDCWRQNGAPLPGWYQIPLKDRTVFLAFDSDAMTKPSVYFALKKFSEFLRSQRADVRIVYLPPGENGEKIGLDDYFVGGGTVASLRALTEDRLRPLHAGIETNNQNPEDVATESLTALRDANDPPRLFLRNGKLCRLRTVSSSALLIETLGENELAYELREATDFFSTSDRRGAVRVDVPAVVVKHLLATPDLSGFPILDSIVTAPIFAPDGTLCLTPGYHPAARVYLHTPEPLNLGDTTPTPENVQKAQHMIFKELLGDFPFTDNASRAHAAAFLLTPFVRALIDGNTPMHIFDAARSRTGKTLLMELTAGVFSPGSPLDTLPNEEAEVRQLLFSLLREGRTHILFDDVSGRVSFPSLRAALTTSDLSGRVLGESRTESVPVSATFALTANNLQTDDQIIGRSVWIRIVANTENPDERQNFKHPDIKAWAKCHRSELITAALTLVQNWIAQGKREEDRQTMGNFGEYVRIIGGILKANGIPGFLENRALLREVADYERDAMRLFVAEWQETHDEAKITAAVLLPLAQEHFPDRLGDGNPASQTKRLGKLLTSKKEDIFNGFRIVSAGKKLNAPFKGATLYGLQSLDGQNSGSMDSLGTSLPPYVREYQENNNEKTRYTPIERGETYSLKPPYFPKEEISQLEEIEL